MSRSHKLHAGQINASFFSHLTLLPNNFNEWLLVMGGEKFHSNFFNPRIILYSSIITPLARPKALAFSHRGSVEIMSPTSLLLSTIICKAEGHVAREHTLHVARNIQTMQEICI